MYKRQASQQRNVVLHPEFVNGKYALYTRPQDDFINAGNGGEMCIRDSFRDDTEFNAESIWEINYDAKGNSGDSWGNGTSDDSFMGNNQMCIRDTYCVVGRCYTGWRNHRGAD